MSILLSAALLGAALGVPGGPYPSVYAGASTPAQTRFLAVDGGRIAYDDTGGKGPLILAIPGMGDLRSEYRLLRPALQNAGLRVVTMDVRGFGETSAQWSDYSAHAVGRDALALLAHLNAGPAIVLGNSFAAGSALWAAHDAPARVCGVVLLGPIVRDQEPSWAAKLALSIGFAGPWRVWVWTSYWDSLFTSSKPADQAQVRAALARNLHEPGRMAALEAMIGLSKADTAAIVPQTRVRALVIMGSRDPDFGNAAAEARWLADQLGAESLLVEGAGHYPQTEMPERVAPTVLSFIAGTTAPAPDERNLCRPLPGSSHARPAHTQPITAGVLERHAAGVHLAPRGLSGDQYPCSRMHLRHGSRPVWQVRVASVPDPPLRRAAVPHFATT